MKRLFTSALVILLAVGAAQAQSTTTDGGKHNKKEHRQDGFDKLNLSADQKTKLQALRADFKKQSQDLKNNASLTAEQKQARRKELHQQFQSQAQAILTKEQKDQLAQLKAERKKEGKNARFQKDGKEGKNGQAWGNRRGGEDRGQRGADLQKELNLTQEQQAKVQQIRTDFRSKLEAVRNDNALTQEQKKTRFHELTQQQQEQMKSVLTKEQQEKMQSLRKEKRNRDTK